MRMNPAIIHIIAEIVIDVLSTSQPQAAAPIALARVKIANSVEKTRPRTSSDTVCNRSCVEKTQLTPPPKALKKDPIMTSQNPSKGAVIIKPKAIMA
jgi:hypothetical protein